jgi:hypothetical protein
VATRSSTVTPDYAGGVLADGAVGYYRLTDAGSGATAVNAALTVGTPGAWANGRYCITTANQDYTQTGGCTASWSTGSPALTRDSTAKVSAYFGGGSYASGGGFIDLPDAPTTLTSSGLTLEAWVYPTSNDSWARIVDLSAGPDTNSIWLSRYATSPDASFGGRQGVNGSAVYLPDTHAANSLPLNTWTHVAVTFTSTGAGTLYVNGNAVASGTGYTWAKVSRAFTFIGRSAYNQDSYFKGYMNEVAIYQQSLTGTQIKAHYTAR